MQCLLSSILCNIIHFVCIETCFPPPILLLCNYISCGNPIVTGLTCTMLACVMTNDIMLLYPFLHYTHNYAFLKRDTSIKSTADSLCVVRLCNHLCNVMSRYICGNCIVQCSFYWLSGHLINVCSKQIITRTCSIIATYLNSSCQLHS